MKKKKNNIKLLARAVKQIALARGGGQVPPPLANIGSAPDVG